MTEGEKNVGLLLVIPAVTDKHTLAVDGIVSLSAVAEEGGGILDLHREALRQATRGIHMPKEYVARRLSHGLAAQITFHDRPDPIDPRHFDWGAIIKQNDGIGVDPSHTLNQLVLAVGHAQMTPVVTFAFKRIGQPGYDDCVLGVFSQIHRFRDQCLIWYFIADAVALRVADTRHAVQSVHQGSDLEAVDMRTAPALIARLFGEIADDGDIFTLILIKRKQVILVF